ncbi:MAG: hypothetical protein HYX74_09330 [Acidobacteria bacterium]|nr:hypothetical protein [Acidobacteriota bacterium]
MQYTYLVGVLLLLFFAFMFLSERLWLKEQKKTTGPAEPQQPRKTDGVQSKPKPKGNKARRK